MGNLNIKNRYDELFTPFSIGNMEVRNRIVMSPMGTYGANMDGSASEGLARYFEERAKGGVGAIITASQSLLWSKGNSADIKRYGQERASQSVRRSAFFIIGCAFCI